MTKINAQATAWALIAALLPCSSAEMVKTMELHQLKTTALLCQVEPATQFPPRLPAVRTEGGWHASHRGHWNEGRTIKRPSERSSLKHKRCAGAKGFRNAQCALRKAKRVFKFNSKEKHI